jgi:hypothetical protein
VACDLAVERAASRRTQDVSGAQQKPRKEDNRRKRNDLGLLLSSLQERVYHCCCVDCKAERAAEGKPEPASGIEIRPVSLPQGVPVVPAPVVRKRGRPRIYPRLEDFVDGQSVADVPSVEKSAQEVAVNISSVAFAEVNEAPPKRKRGRPRKSEGSASRGKVTTSLMRRTEERRVESAWESRYGVSAGNSNRRTSSRKSAGAHLEEILKKCKGASGDDFNDGDGTPPFEEEPPSAQPQLPAPGVKRKRGRPRKIRPLEGVDVATITEVAAETVLDNPDTPMTTVSGVSEQDAVASSASVGSSSGEVDWLSTVWLLEEAGAARRSPPPTRRDASENEEQFPFAMIDDEPDSDGVAREIACISPPPTLEKLRDMKPSSSGGKVSGEALASEGGEKTVQLLPLTSPDCGHLSEIGESPHRQSVGHRNEGERDLQVKRALAFRHETKSHLYAGKLVNGNEDKVAGCHNNNGDRTRKPQSQFASSDRADEMRKAYAESGGRSFREWRELIAARRKMNRTPSIPTMEPTLLERAALTSRMTRAALPPLLLENDIADEVLDETEADEERPLKPLPQASSARGRHENAALERARSPNQAQTGDFEGAFQQGDSHWFVRDEVALVNARSGWSN